MLSGGDAELYADFRRFYALDLDYAWSLGARRVADLAAGLPPGCRSMAKVSPELAWSADTWMLSRIEYYTHSVLWSLGGGKGERPRQVKPDGIGRETGKMTMYEPELARILARPRVAL